MADFTALKTAIQTYIKQNGNEEITGEKLQEILLSVVTTLGDSAINDLVTALANEVAARQNADGTLQQNITNEATARGNADMALSNRLGSSITAENTAADQIGAEAEARSAADTALQGLINGINTKLAEGYLYAGIATPSSTPATGKVFYLALTAGTYTNFGNTVVSQGINILKYNGSAWSLDAFIGIDDTPTPNSPKLVKSSGIFDSVMTNGSAFDLSAHFASGGTLAAYADLSAALTALNTLSTSYKRGGMSIKFVQSTDSKYVRYRFMLSTFTAAQFTNAANWQGVDDEPTAGSDNLVKSGGIEEAIFNEKEITKEIVPLANRARFYHGYIVNGNGADIGDTISLEVIDSTSWVCAIIECQENDVITIMGKGATSPTGAAQIWSILDSDNKILAKNDAQLYTQKTKIVCPANSAKLVFNNEIEFQNYCCYKGESAIDEINEQLSKQEEDINKLCYLEASDYKYLRSEDFLQGGISPEGEEPYSTENLVRSNMFRLTNGRYKISAKTLSGYKVKYFLSYYDSDKEFVRRDSFLDLGEFAIDNTGYSYLKLVLTKVDNISGLIVNTSVSEIDGFDVVLASVDVSTLKQDVSDIKDACISDTEILPANDKLTSEQVVSDGKVGDWAIRYTTGGNSVIKNDDNSFRVTLNNAGGSNPAFWLQNILPADVIGKRVKIKVKMRKVTGNSILIAGVKSSIFEENLFNSFFEYEWNISNYSNVYEDRRIMFFTDSSLTFDIKEISFEIIETALEKIATMQSDIEDVEEFIAGTEIQDIKLPLRNFLYKLASIARGGTVQAVIGLLGDSWTQHSWSTTPSHGEEGVYNLHSNYVQPLTKYLRTKYGDAGAGYYSFSESHIGAGDTKMMSADYDDAWDERSANNSGLITYRDQVEGCKGIDAADTIFHNGAFLMLHATTPQSIFILHFYGSAGAGQFTYTLDNDNPVTVDASQYNGYSTLKITTTDATHTLRIDCISGDVMIFGVDMQRNVAGVRVHKIGNKGATSTSFVIVDADSWKAGIEALELDSMTILLGTNDGSSAGSTIKTNLKTITDRVKTVNQFIDLQVIQPSNNEEHSIAAQAPYQHQAAKEIGAGFINLIPLFGSVEEINDKETCIGVHATLDGGYMIFEHLIRCLDLFKL